MKIKGKLLKKFMDKYGIDAGILAEEMGVSVLDVDELLAGDAVEDNIAEKFLYYFGAAEALKMVDWKAMGKAVPPDIQTDDNNGACES